jgi:hypothetical protein
LLRSSISGEANHVSDDTNQSDKEQLSKMMLWLT